MAFPERISAPCLFVASCYGTPNARIVMDIMKCCGYGGEWGGGKGGH